MNNPQKKQVAEIDPLKREALVWVQRLTSDEATVEDGEAFKLWCGRSSAHEAAFKEASRLWKDLGPVTKTLRSSREAFPGLAHDRSADRTGGHQPSRRRFVLGAGLAAASVAAYAVVRPPFHLWPSLTELQADYRTATGEQRDVALADNVTVRMNTQTSLSVETVGHGVDRITLIAGEASFATMPKAGRSLVVTAGQGRTIAAGAQFDIRRFGNDDGQLVCVTCTDGVVRVEHRSQTTTINAGEQIQYGESGIGSVTTIDSEIVSAWQRGVLIFRETPLSAVVDEINRYRPGRVILLNKPLGQTRVSGRFRTNHMDEILARIEETFDAKVHTLPGGIVLLS